MAMSRILKIGTHNGTFHCDEVLACFMLKQLPEFKDASIIRSRDEAVLNTCDIVVDVGGVYDPAKRRFDHHQRTFTENFNSLDSRYKWKTKLSSAGLVYYHYGHQIISEILELSDRNSTVEKIFLKMYENFIEEIDAIDNGVEHCLTEPRYLITTHLSARVGRINPVWNEKAKDEDALFHKAMGVVGEEFLDRLHWYAKSWLPARDIVVDAINKRSQVDPSEEILVFEAGGCPWKDHIYELEEDMNLAKSIKFILYPDTAGSWRIQCVNVRPCSFHSRIPLPEYWRGKRDKQLAAESGIDDAIFVHATGFIGGCQSRQSALAMAKMALEQKTTREKEANGSATA